MKKRLLSYIGTLVLTLLLLGCAGAPLEFGTVEKTAQLHPGMMHEDVVRCWANPSRSSSPATRPY